MPARCAATECLIADVMFTYISGSGAKSAFAKASVEKYFVDISIMAG
jgi:hypothetical protein